MADTRVEDETAAATLTGAEILYCVQAGGPRNLTVDRIAAYAANPPTSDGRALGSAALQWSDAFLASGAVIDFGGGNYQITHSAGLQTFSGAVKVSSSAASSNSTTGAETIAGGLGVVGDGNFGGTISCLAAVGALKSSNFSFTRDMTLASGNTVHTGIGFKPSSIIAFASISGVSTNDNTSWGLVDQNKLSYSLFMTTAFQVGSGLIQAVNAAGTASQVAAVFSYDTDGFTLAWTKTGAPAAGTLFVRLICFR